MDGRDTVTSWWALAVWLPMIFGSLAVGVFELSRLLTDRGLPLAPFLRRPQAVAYLLAGPCMACVYLLFLIGAGLEVGGDGQEASAARLPTIGAQLLAGLLAVLAIPRSAFGLATRGEDPPPPNKRDIAIISHDGEKTDARAYVRTWVAYVVAKTLENVEETMKRDRERRASRYCRHIPHTHVLNLATLVFTSLGYPTDDLPEPAQVLAKELEAFRSQTAGRSEFYVKQAGFRLLEHIESPNYGKASRQRGSELLKAAAAGTTCRYRWLRRKPCEPTVDAVESLIP